MLPENPAPITTFFHFGWLSRIKLESGVTCINNKSITYWYIKDALLVFLREYKIINASQHGFMARKSTTAHLLEYNLDRNTAIKSRHGVDIVHLDFAKAFDSVVRTKIIAKLQCFMVFEVRYFVGSNLGFVIHTNVFVLVVVHHH